MRPISFTYRNSHRKEKPARAGLSALTEIRSSVILERHFAFLPDGRRENEMRRIAAAMRDRRDRRDEDRGVAAREQQRASQILFHHRPENEARNERRCLASKLDKEEEKPGKTIDDTDIEDVVIDRIRADHAERDDREVIEAVRP